MTSLDYAKQITPYSTEQEKAAIIKQAQDDKICEIRVYLEGHFYNGWGITPAEFLKWLREQSESPA